jgi:hypothetical protein
MSIPAPMARPPEVAAVLRVSVKTLANWRWRGTGPAFTKAGHSVRYEWADVRAYKEGNRRGRGK